jgi:hypothetical protein
MIGLLVVPPLASWKRNMPSSKLDLGWPAPPPSRSPLGSGYQVASPDSHRSGPLIQRKDYKKGLYRNLHICPLLVFHTKV